jgi:N6-adenosine-specific RNA methylase IME4
MHKTDITITRTDKVDVIYADPCWGYRNVKTGGSHVSGAAQKYQVLTPAEIAALPVREIVNPKGAVCFLWATVPLGRDPYDVLHAWGFEFKTEWFWRKVGRKGTGYWTRGAVEKLLIGIRGTVPAWRSTLDNVIEAGEDENEIATKPAGHSQKPEAVIRRIEQLTLGAGRRVELFASHHSAQLAHLPRLEAAERGEDPDAAPTWECYGLDLGHDFTEPNFWARLLGEPEQPILLDEEMPTLADA